MKFSEIFFILVKLKAHRPTLLVIFSLKFSQIGFRQIFPLHKLSLVTHFLVIYYYRRTKKGEKNGVTKIGNSHHLLSKNRLNSPEFVKYSQS